MLRTRRFYLVVFLLLSCVLLILNVYTNFFHSKMTITPESSQSITDRFTERRLSIEKKCAALETRKFVKLVTGHKPRNFTLCVVPKAACTIWLRLFRYLVNKEALNKTLVSYSKYDVHVMPGNTYKRYNFNGNDKEFIMNSVRAMTARDPYTRLWSAYIDKLLLPDFWKLKGKQVIKMTRPNATDAAKRCGNDVTFPEFIQYVLEIGHSMAYWVIDYHWLPVSDICDPCVFKPDFIVKQETFLSDFTTAVDRVGLLDEVRPVLEADQDEYEIETEIDYNFRLYNRQSNCISKLEMAKILWKALQLNGYLNPDEEYPAGIDKEDINKDLVLENVRSARKRSGANRHTKKMLRKQALIAAYNQLSSTQLKALQELYKSDFEMFDYDITPPA